MVCRGEEEEVVVGVVDVESAVADEEEEMEDKEVWHRIRWKVGKDLTKKFKF